jgi:CBS domain-containing protein
MLVSQILRSKADDGVLTVREDVTVGEAARILSERRIGSLVVSEDGRRASGILSERDIVREIGRWGAACLAEPVAALMTREVVTCSRGDSADGVLAAMTEGRFRHLPVVEGGELVGLISIGDVVKARLAELSMENDALEGMIKGY